MERMDTIGGERRSDRRYELQLELRWKLIKRRRVVDAGVGYTLDLSSGGIRFHAGRELPVGLNVELTVQWPILLNNTAPMSLSIYGRIVRTSEGWAAIRTMQHEFRTAGSLSLGERGMVGGSGGNQIPRAPGFLMAPAGGRLLSKLH